MRALGSKSNDLTRQAAESPTSGACGHYRLGRDRAWTFSETGPCPAIPVRLATGRTFRVTERHSSDKTALSTVRHRNGLSSYVETASGPDPGSRVASGTNQHRTH
jgi:hypothetical protein